MDAATLVKRLRKRALPALARECGSYRDARLIIASENTIWNCLTCYLCQKKLVADPSPVIARVRDAKEFEEAAVAFQAAHLIEDHGEVVRNRAEMLTATALRDSLRYYLGEVQHAQKAQSGQDFWDAAEAWAYRRWASAKYETHPAVGAGPLRGLVRRALRTCRGLDDYQWLYVFSAGSVTPCFECWDDPVARAIVDSHLERMAEGGGGLIFTLKVHFPRWWPLVWLEFRELVVTPKGKPANGAA